MAVVKSSSCLCERKKKKQVHLLFQPVVVLHDACHDHISTLHVEGDLSRRFVLKKNYTGHKTLL